MYSIVVVGTDGSSTAKKAVAHAMELVAGTDGTLHIVSAYRPRAAGKVGTKAENWYVDSATMVDTILDSSAALARSKGLKVETHAAEGDAADAIVDVAKAVNADAVVIGNKGMRGAKRFLLGSVPNNVAHHASCTVVIVKTT